ncbi:MAG: SDR family NAD(P)-dependent oxidoreductase [Dehalococcoidales bacterium]|jgi:NAD(P)-dependent dehydrogenase (short-subunit alcohol dehydrogenase family)
MENVAGKVAFITGGASGIGLGMAKVFAANGMKVVILDMRQEALDEAMAYFNRLKQPAHPIKVDITNREAYARAADEAERIFGKIHVLVNNAGASVIANVRTANYKDWDYIMGTNVGGVINGVVTVLPRILKHGEGGHVVTTSSSLGMFAMSGMGLYCTTKYAVAGMMEALAAELEGTGVGASVYFPGPVRTNFGVSNKANRPDHLKNEGPEVKEPNPMNDAGYMEPEEVGERILRGIRRNDLFIMSHPEFRKGIQARNRALLRALPDEPPNKKRIAVLKTTRDLLYNPMYDKQTTPGAPDWTTH